MNLFDKDTYQALLQKKKKIESTTLKEFFNNLKNHGKQEKKLQPKVLQGI